MSDERLSESALDDTGVNSGSVDADSSSDQSEQAKSPTAKSLDLPREYGGRKGPEPVRYGDWEKNGRCIDF